MRKIIFAVLAAAAFATPAYSQDSGNARFTGGHAELLFGVDRAGISIGGDDSSRIGFAYGIAGGYDFAAGRNGIVGLEIEAADATTDLCVGADCISAGRDLYLGGRAGVAVNGAGLVYLKAGYTNARVTADIGGVRDGVNLDGLRVGGGVELTTNSPVVVRLEYRYSNYENDVDRHQGMFGVGLRF